MALKSMHTTLPQGVGMPQEELGNVPGEADSSARPTREVPDTLAPVANARQAMSPPVVVHVPLVGTSVASVARWMPVSPAVVTLLGASTMYTP